MPSDTKHRELIDPEAYLRRLSAHDQDSSSDADLEEIEVLLAQKTTNSKKQQENLVKALALSVTKMKGYHKKEKRLTKKVELLEHKLNKDATSRFGTGKLLSNMEPGDIEMSISDNSGHKKVLG